MCEYPGLILKNSAPHHIKAFQIQDFPATVVQTDGSWSSFLLQQVRNPAEPGQTSRQQRPLIPSLRSTLFLDRAAEFLKSKSRNQCLVGEEGGRGIEVGMGGGQGLLFRSAELQHLYSWSVKLWISGRVEEAGGWTARNTRSSHTLSGLERGKMSYIMSGWQQMSRQAC